MRENKQRLHALIDSVSDSGTVEYLLTFITLFLQKWGGAKA